MELRFEVDDLSGAATRALIEHHLRGMFETSPPESVHALDIDRLRAPHITVWSCWFGGDLAYPVMYEPSGTDFLSPGLCEAVLMQRVLGDAFAAWWSAFMPASLARWEAPAVVSDRLDGQLVHLDGLNLSRAGCLWTF